MIRDNDGKYGPKFAAVAEGAGIDVVSIPPRSPNLTPSCERFLGSVRRECLDHIVILGEDHLRRVLKQYVHVYFNLARPHQGLGQHIPGSVGRPPGEPTVGGDIVVTPILGGLHHDYRLAAWQPARQGPDGPDVRCSQHDRVFYDVSEGEGIVYVRAVRRKPPRTTTEGIL